MVRNIRLVHFSSIVGLIAFLVLRPEGRLILVALGVWNGCLAWTTTFYAERSQPHRLEARISAFTLGLFASSLAKFAFWTNNPIWPIMHGPNGGMNYTGLILAIPAILLATRSTASRNGDAPAPGPQKGSPLLAGLGLAGLFFCMHSMLSDSSTMITWVWEGFPVRGPIAVHGVLTFFAMGGGLLLGMFYPNIARSWTAFGIGSVGAAVVTLYHNWLGYLGALSLATYTMAVAPILIASAVRYSPARTFGLGWLVYNFMVLFHVWVVAYAFVPGGPLVRERTDWVVTAMMLLIGCGVFSAGMGAPHGPSATGRGKGKNKSGNPAARKQRSYYIYILFAFELLAMSIAYLRFPENNYTPYHPDEK
ncbi:hypothetical protein LTS18_000562, partial [Coniosporium uncinatum]